MFYPGSGPLDGDKTLRHALVYIDDHVSSTELIYLESVCCGLNPKGTMNVITIYRLV